MFSHLFGICYLFHVNLCLFCFVNLHVLLDSYPAPVTITIFGYRRWLMVYLTTPNENIYWNLAQTVFVWFQSFFPTNNLISGRGQSPFQSRDRGSRALRHLQSLTLHHVLHIVSSHMTSGDVTIFRHLKSETMPSLLVTILDLWHDFWSCGFWSWDFRSSDFWYHQFQWLWWHRKSRDLKSHDRKSNDRKWRIKSKFSTESDVIHHYLHPAKGVFALSCMCTWSWRVPVLYTLDFGLGIVLPQSFRHCALKTVSHKIVYISDKS